ncbi:MAG: iron ABC transporter permease, partial [Duncaniella sp.]|nr:iron ABC transporter permease [Duncaniella sp.]
MTRRASITILLAAVALIVFTVLQLFTGSTRLDCAQVWQALVSPAQASAQAVRIVVDIRLVKALTALLAGAALGVSGLEMQTLFRNPLAGPYVLGVSA